MAAVCTICHQEGCCEDSHRAGEAGVGLTPRFPYLPIERSTFCVPRPPEHPEFGIPVCRRGTPHCQVDHSAKGQSTPPPSTCLTIRRCRLCTGLDIRFGGMPVLSIHPYQRNPDDPDGGGAPCRHSEKDFGPDVVIAEVPW